MSLVLTDVAVRAGLRLDLDLGLYNGLHKNWPFAYFGKITVALGWIYIKVWPIPHLKELTTTF